MKTSNVLSNTIVANCCLLGSSHAAPAPNNVSPLTHVRAPIAAHATSRFNTLLAQSSHYQFLTEHAGAELLTVPVQIGSHKFNLLLNINGGDSWVAKAGVDCLARNGTALPTSSCGFGSLFKGSASLIPSENIYIPYSGGFNFSGDVGSVDIKVAGHVIKDQEIGLIDTATVAQSLDGFISGVIGLAYSSTTHVFHGTSIAKDNFNLTGSSDGERAEYSSVIDSMFKHREFFSLAVMRASNEITNTSPAGYIAFGALPPVQFKHKFVTVPIEKFQYPLQPDRDSKVLTRYVFSVDSYHTYDGTTGTSEQVSSGSVPSTLYTTDIAIQVPRAVYNSYISSIAAPVTVSDDIAFVPCGSTVPPLGVNIGGTVFNISGADIVYPSINFTDASTGVTKCAIIVVSGDDMPTLGTSFLKNVVVVFDLLNSALKFAKHDY